MAAIFKVLTEDEDESCRQLLLQKISGPMNVSLIADSSAQWQSRLVLLASQESNAKLYIKGKKKERVRGFLLQGTEITRKRRRILKLNHSKNSMKHRTNEAHQRIRNRIQTIYISRRGHYLVPINSFSHVFMDENWNIRIILITSFEII